MAMELKYPFYTYTVDAIATNGTTTAIAVPALNQFTMKTNASQVVVLNPSNTLTLYVIPYNGAVDSAGGVAIENCVPIGAGGSWTIALGSRAKRVGTPIICGITTDASSFEFTITEIYSIEE